MADSPTTVSFASDILPLFRQIDIDHMAPLGVTLDDYAYMSQPANAEHVLASLKDGFTPRMPPGGPYWNDEQLQLLANWIAGGCAP